MQKLQLSIPEPCHENWQQMTPTDQGRFCKACAKEVIDFSTMTDMQVLNYFSTLTHEKVCGRALPEQLNRTISRPIEPKKRLFWYWNYIVMFFMFFGKGNVAKAQGDVKITTQFSPVKQNGINKTLAGKVGEVLVKNDSRVISGKVTDIDGNPVSFASVKIKGTPTGVSADANGVYSLRVNPNDVLVISGASFKTVEVPVSNQSVVNTVLQVGMTGQMEIIVSGVFGGMIGTSMDYSAPDKTKAVAILKVKDEETGKFLPDVSVLITKNGSSDTVFTDRKGMYKIKGITEYARYFIKVFADGYEGNEFTINETDFKDRKKEWEVLLRKQKIKITTPIEVGNSVEVITKALCTKRVVKESKPLFVVDGNIMPNGADINPDDVEDYSVLQAPQATAIYGSEGSNGAIVITTRKVKEKSLDTVVITTGPFWSCKKIWSEVTKLTKIETNNLQKDLSVKQNQFLVYPNPVQRGNTFNISLKLKQTGLYQIQITDATGRVVLRKQIHAVSKEFTEKIQADNRWSSGIYFINLIDNKNQLLNKSSFILQ